MRHSGTRAGTARIAALSTVIGLAGLGLSTGCSSTGTRLILTTYYEDGVPQQHYADFPEAYYAHSAAGTLELVLRAERPSSVDPTQSITQLVYLKTFWNPQPGRTYVQATQINARVQYAVLTPPTGVRYDGGAFITCKLDKDGDTLTGEVESGTLTPRFRMGEAVEPFGPAKFEGTFTARHRPGEVRATHQFLTSQFGRHGTEGGPSETQ